MGGEQRASRAFQFSSFCRSSPPFLCNRSAHHSALSHAHHSQSFKQIPPYLSRMRYSDHCSPSSWQTTVASSPFLQTRRGAARLPKEEHAKSGRSYDLCTVAPTNSKACEAGVKLGKRRRLIGALRLRESRIACCDARVECDCDITVHFEGVPRVCSALSEHHSRRVRTSASSGEVVADVGGPSQRKRDCPRVQTAVRAQDGDEWRQEIGDLHNFIRTYNASKLSALS